MILECPNCATRFKVPDNAIGPDGRVVKCAKCGHSWKATPEDAIIEQVPTPKIKKVRVKKAAAKKAVAKKLVKKVAKKAPSAKPTPEKRESVKASQVKEEEIAPTTPIVEDVIEEQVAPSPDPIQEETNPTSTSPDIEDVGGLDVDPPQEEEIIDTETTAEPEIETESAAEDSSFDVEETSVEAEENHIEPELISEPEPMAAPSFPAPNNDDDDEVRPDADSIEDALAKLVQAVEAKEGGPATANSLDADDEMSPAEDIAASLSAMGDEQDAPAAAALKAPTKNKNKGRPALRKKGMSAPAKSLVVLAAMLFLTVNVGYFFMKDIQIAYPPSQKLYEALGLHADILGHGLELNSPKAARTEINGTTYLVIQGEVENTTSRTLNVPIIKASLKNSRDRDVHIWYHELNTPDILPGEVAKYELRVEQSQAQGGTNLTVTFATETEMEKEKLMTEGG